MANKLGSLFQTLGMNDTNGLIKTEEENATVFQRHFFTQVKEKMGLDAVYFLRDSDGIPKIPLIYFSAMDTYDADKIAELHRLAWNTGEAPLLFVVLPDQLLVYNNYAPPGLRRDDGSYDEKTGLYQTISLVSDLEFQRQELLNYHRTKIETGEFWRENRFNDKARVDTTLLDNLKAIRKTLLLQIRKRHTDSPLDMQTQSEIVHGLLGRSILIKYLEERTDSSGCTVFPAGFFNKFLTGANEYTDVLADKDATYALFRELEEKFNGDMFPLVDQEIDTISQDDLTELQQFILGKSELASRQMVLWPLYSFNVIPIQLISSIYELFFHLAEVDPDKDNGTYYTPFHLVSMLMDEVLSWEGAYTPTKILDPSCGSGIFLVEAYRRLVCKWMSSNNTNRISPANLVEIMQSCIYGVDCNKEAIRIASFSLSLAMCDYLEPRTIWDELQFPRMLHYNLFHNDFFDHNPDFENRNYNIVIGNPPWESALSSAAKQYVDDNNCIVGDKQIAQAFTWRTAEICPNGVICLLLPSKGFLFNRSTRTSAYRRAFFEKCDVSIIINYSAFRWVLFQHAVGPAVGVVYRAQKNDKRNIIYYCTPKPLYTVEDRRRFLIEPTDICKIPIELTGNDLIWKIAMWGSPRDMDLVNMLQTVHTPFRDILDSHGMSHAEGYKKGNKKKVCTDFLDKPFLSAKTFVPGNSDPEDLPKVDFVNFECTVEKSRSIFEAPHLVIKQSHKKSRFLVDVLDFDAVFNHSFLGIHGPDEWLKFFGLIISSKVFSYYQLMTNRRWLVERDELEAGDILATPFPIPTESALAEATELFHRVFRQGKDIELVDQFAYRQYNLRPYEISLVTDAIDSVYDYYSRKEKSNALKPPTTESISSYFDVMRDVLTNSLGKSSLLTCHINYGNSPLIVADLDLTGNSDNMFSVNTISEDMDALLETLDKQLIEERSGSVFVKRNVRIYTKNKIYIVKPKQARYWNYSAACRDADDIYADVMKAWRSDYEQH